MAIQTNTRCEIIASSYWKVQRCQAPLVFAVSRIQPPCLPRLHVEYGPQLKGQLQVHNGKSDTVQVCFVR